MTGNNTHIIISARLILDLIALWTAEDSIYVIPAQRLCQNVIARSFSREKRRGDLPDHEEIASLNLAMTFK